MAEEDPNRLGVCLKLAELIAFAEDKHDGARPRKHPDAREYWMTLFGQCYGITSQNAELRARTIKQASEHKGSK